jgi:HAD superfamily hydrolase (TIGR01549 family)
VSAPSPTELGGGHRIRAVTFDYWNTLVVAYDEALFRKRVEHVADVLATAGYVVTPDDVDQAFAGSWKTFQESWKANRQHVTIDGVERVLELLEIPAEGAVVTELVAHFESGALESELALAPNVAETLQALKDADVRLGIICDVGMTPSTSLRKVLDGFGVMDLFDHHSFSDDVGTYKPDPVIFAHALDGLGGSPQTSAHVGDLRRTDVAGANGAGWTSVRYTGLFDDDGGEQPAPAGVADHVIHDHAELTEALGLT